MQLFEALVTGQRFFAYSYLILMLFFIALETLSLVTKHWRLRHPIQWWAFRFLKLNFYSCEGAYKKCVRLFDTLGSFFGLAGLLLGLFSLLCDQVRHHEGICAMCAKCDDLMSSPLSVRPGV